MNDVPTNEPTRETRERLEALGYAIYEGPVPFDEVPIPEPPNAEDYRWVWSNRELHAQYQGLVVAVRDRKVWGAGKSHSAAWEDARQKADCPARDDLIFVEIWGMPWTDENAADRSPGS
jgi:hypothetical protein